MAKFFVLRGYRRNGVGTLAAHEVWGRLPGSWEVRVMQSNLLAHSFREQAIRKFTGKPLRPLLINKDGKTWQLFSFESC